MLVKELKEFLSEFPDYSEIMICNDEYLFDISRTARLVNIDSKNHITLEKDLDSSFDEKEAVVMLQTF